MNEEIFGPILPIIEYENVQEAIDYIHSYEKSLALYLFTNDKKLEKQILSKTSFGGGCINDTIIHIANSNMPFGGVGYSGIGGYHGKSSFDTFSHYRSITKILQRYYKILRFCNINKSYWYYKKNIVLLI